MSPSDAQPDEALGPGAPAVGPSAVGPFAVDFVVGGDVQLADDGELSELPRSHVLRRVLLGGATAAVAGVLIARAVAAPQVNPASHVPISYQPSDGTEISAADDPQPARLDAGTDRIVGCPELQACTVDRSVPVDLVTAVREVVPDAHVRSVVTVLGLRDGSGAPDILQRTIMALAGSTRIDIELHQSTPADVVQSGAGVDAQYVISYYHDLVPGYAVAVEAAGRARPPRLRCRPWTCWRTSRR